MRRNHDIKVPVNDDEKRRIEERAGGKGRVAAYLRALALGESVATPIEEPIESVATPVVKQPAKPTSKPNAPDGFHYRTTIAYDDQGKRTEIRRLYENE